MPFFLFVLCCWFIPYDGSWIFGWFYNFLTFHMFIYIVFSFLNLRRSGKAEKLVDQTKLRTWLTHFLVVNMVFILLYFLISEMIIPFYIGISFLFSSVIVYLSFWALKNPFLFKIAIVKYSQSKLESDEGEQLMKKLQTLMEQEKPFLDPDLNLSKLSAQLG